MAPALVRLGRRVRAWIFEPTPREEVDEELDFHVAMVVRQRVAEGWSREQAVREAERRFGDVEAVKRVCRESGERRVRRMRRRASLEGFAQDVGVALRQLRRNPTFAAVAIVTLALGIGANAAVFSVVNGVLLRPLDYPEPDRLVRMWTRFFPESGYEGERFPLSPAEALDYRDGTEVLEAVAYYAVTSVTLSGDGGDPARLVAVAASDDLLPLLGVPPMLGRWFGPEEDVPGAPPVAVLEHRLWVDRFGSDAGILGRTLMLGGVPTRVVGVMPPGFAFPDADARLVLPYRLDEAAPGGRGGHGIRALGRLAPGRSFAEAEEELAALTVAWREAYGHPQPGHFTYLTPLHEDAVLAVAQPLWTLMAAVALVLLIGTANVANLLLARGETRVHELSLRAALGAGRSRIVRQLLTESLVLAALAGALGAGLAAGATGMWAPRAVELVPHTATIALDAEALGFTVLVAVGVALLFGAVPALQAARMDPSAGLAAGRSATSSGRRLTFRKALVTAEITLSVVVVLGAGLVGRSFAKLVQVDPGVEAEGRLTFGLELRASDYDTPEAVAAGIDALVERLDGVPGVQSASFTSSLPITGARWLPDFRIEGRPQPAQGERALSAATETVTPGHLATLGIGVVRGRAFEVGDRAEAPLVALVNEEAARVFWPGEDALGRRIGFRFGTDDVPWATIVGVVTDTRTDGLAYPVRPQIYLPHAQRQGFWGATTRAGYFVLRTARPPLDLVPEVRRAVGSFDPGLALESVRSLDQVVTQSVSRSRLLSALLGGFGLVAILLAAIGVYGVVAYTVARRTREIGIRLALGAGRRRVIRRMLREGAWPAIAGVVLGVGLGLAGARLVEGLLYGVAPTDPLTFVTLPLGLLAVALVASWVPTRAATRVPPGEVLRDLP